MQILSKACGSYQTNCYVLKTDNGEIIIDPGVNAYEWLLGVCKNPIAVLNTHGHFDHVWDNEKVQKGFDIPLFTPKDDAFLLSNDIFGIGVPVSTPDTVVEPDTTVLVGGMGITFLHYPGHTPGCSAIVVGDVMFSGDFIFRGSIGRVDFPYSEPQEMIKSLKKFLALDRELKIYPGHGGATDTKTEKNSAAKWVEMLIETSD